MKKQRNFDIWTYLYLSTSHFLFYKKSNHKDKKVWSKFLIFLEINHFWATQVRIKVN